MQSTTLIWLFLGLLTLIQALLSPSIATSLNPRKEVIDLLAIHRREITKVWYCFDMDFHHGWSEIADNKASLVIEELLKYKTEPVYKKGCVRVMCVGNTSATVCNDNEHVVTVSTDTMAAFVGAVQDVCGRKFKKKLDDECGQTFDEKKFNVIVRAENCNDIVVEPPE